MSNNQPALPPGQPRKPDARGPATPAHPPEAPGGPIPASSPGHGTQPGRHAPGEQRSNGLAPYGPGAAQAARPSPSSQDRAPTGGEVRERTGERPAREVAPLPRAAPGEVKIGLWGSPLSGKTTFLGALRLATNQAIGRWNILPDNPASSESLTQLTHTLVTRQEFPPATSLGTEFPLRWHFVGDLSGTETARKRRWPLAGREPELSRFMLDLIDVSGEAFGYDPANKHVAASVVNSALNHLTEAQGLIYLFDPIGEQELHNSAEYLNRTMVLLLERVMRQGRLKGAYLPHHVSVCITKFDDPAFFNQVRAARLVNSQNGMWRVLDRDAETLFNLICEGRFWKFKDERSYASAYFIKSELNRCFAPDKIRYFVTSSVGFLKPAHGFAPGGGPQTQEPDPRNFSNTYEVAGKKRIRGPIVPVNVLEPLISLHQRLKNEGRTRG